MFGELSKNDGQVLFSLMGSLNGNDKPFTSNLTFFWFSMAMIGCPIAAHMNLFLMPLVEEGDILARSTTFLIIGCNRLNTGIPLTVPLIRISSFDKSESKASDGN